VRSQGQPARKQRGRSLKKIIRKIERAKRKKSSRGAGEWRRLLSNGGGGKGWEKGNSKWRKERGSRKILRNTMCILKRETRGHLKHQRGGKTRRDSSDPKKTRKNPEKENSGGGKKPTFYGGKELRKGGGAAMGGRVGRCRSSIGKKNNLERLPLTRERGTG